VESHPKHYRTAVSEDRTQADKVTCPLCAGGVPLKTTQIPVTAYDTDHHPVTLQLSPAVYEKVMAAIAQSKPNP